jgi:hypothetical protein
LNVGPFIFAGALLGAVAAQTSFAEGAAQGWDRHQGLNQYAESNGSRSPRHVNPSLKIGTPGNFPAHRLSTSGAPKFTERNAIGAPVAEHDGIRSRDDESHGLPAHISPPVVQGTSAGEAGGLNESKGGIERPTNPHSSASPIVIAPVSQRGTVSGTGLIRPSTTPSGLGGPAKVAVGINGSNIRSKHP